MEVPILFTLIRRHGLRRRHAVLGTRVCTLTICTTICTFFTLACFYTISNSYILDYYKQGYHLGLQVLPANPEAKPAALSYIRTKQNLANDPILCNLVHNDRVIYMFQNYM